MKEDNIQIRLMKVDDYDAIVHIDEKVLKTSRPNYYKLKFERLFQSKDYLPTSLVAEKGGKVIGFVMGELFIGEYCIFEETATLDTIGVDPYYQNQGVGEKLVKEFFEHLKSLGVQKVTTLVSKGDRSLMHFFKSNQFAPSQTINLERRLW